MTTLESEGEGVEVTEEAVAVVVAIAAVAGTVEMIDGLERSVVEDMVCSGGTDD